LFVPPAPEHLQERKNFAEVHPVLAETAKTKKTEKLCKPTTIDAAITFSFSWFFFCSGDIP
jgi:hypothetical protein